MLFEVDARNSERQRFCSKPECQRERRRREQRLRRATALDRLCADLLNDDPRAARRLQVASQIPEALIESQSPILIGLISMLIDSNDREEISKTLHKLWQRGVQILHPGLASGDIKALERRTIATKTAGVRVKR